MTLEEAKLFLALGAKLTHFYFSHEEWITACIEPDREAIIFEDNTRVCLKEFWDVRQDDDWANGWKIYVDN